MPPDSREGAARQNVGGRLFGGSVVFQGEQESPPAQGADSVRGSKSEDRSRSRRGDRLSGNNGFAVENPEMNLTVCGYLKPGDDECGMFRFRVHRNGGSGLGEPAGIDERDGCTGGDDPENVFRQFDPGLEHCNAFRLPFQRTDQVLRVAPEPGQESGDHHESQSHHPGFCSAVAAVFRLCGISVH